MKTLETWEKATDAIAAQFIAEVFPESYYNGDWVAGDIGGVLCVGDYFIDVEHIVDYFRYKATPQQFFKYYDRELENAWDDKPVGISFKNFVKYGWDLKGNKQ